MLIYDELLLSERYWDRFSLVVALAKEAYFTLDAQLTLEDEYVYNIWSGIYGDYLLCWGYVFDFSPTRIVGGGCLFNIFAYFGYLVQLVAIRAFSIFLFNLPLITRVTNLQRNKSWGSNLYLISAIAGVKIYFFSTEIWPTDIAQWDSSPILIRAAHVVILEFLLLIYIQTVSLVERKWYKDM